jgi:electron transfer flavoprotein alpha subunit
MDIEVIKDKCTGCGVCVSVCLYNAIDIVDGIAQINENCTLCGACVPECPEEAIVLEKKVEEAKPKDYKGVCVFAEQENGNLHKVVFELLSKGRELADKLDVELSTIFLGSGIEDKAQELIERGADNVYLVDREELKSFSVETYTVVITRLINKYKPEIFIGGATSTGRSLLPRIAARLKTGLTADCTGLDIGEDGILLQTRPAFGGNIMATIECRTKRPQMSTVRYKVMPEAKKSAGREGKIVKENFEQLDLTSRTKIIEFVEDVTQKINLQEAEIIVAGGMGLRDPSNFKIIEEFAEVLDAAVGSSRPPVDAGWIPYSHQVGQTGRTVRPKLYIACGISGQIQHLAGMSSSEYIVAINKDPSAPIFQVADLSIVGDLFQIVPSITKKLKEIR